MAIVATMPPRPRAANPVPAAPLPPVERQPLARLVAERILELIRTQPLEPGSKLPSERELMEQLGVGRSSVREALNGLALMNVVEVRQGQGAFVVGLPDNIGADKLERALSRGASTDLLEARETIELRTVQLAARRATDEELGDLRAVLAAAGEALGSDAPLAPLSARFHVLIAVASHNQVLQEMVGLLSGSLEARGPGLERLPGYREWEMAEHRGILEALEARDEDLAVDRMRRHLDAMVEHLQRAE